MIVTLEWTDFMRYLNTGIVYVKENDDSWEFWTSDNMFFVKAIVEKKEDQAENIMFIERYVAGKENILKVREIMEGNIPIQPKTSESTEAIREEDEDLEMTDDDYIDNLGGEDELRD